MKQFSNIQELLLHDPPSRKGEREKVLLVSNATCGQAHGSAALVETLKEAWEKNGSDVPDLAGKAFGDYVSSEIKRWGKVVADAGVKIE